MRDGPDILHGIKASFEHMGHLGQDVGHRHQQGIAIGRLREHVFDRQCATSTGAVFHHHGLLDLMRQLIADDARKHINRAARRGRNNELDGFIGKREGAASRQSGSQSHG